MRTKQTATMIVAAFALAAASACGSTGTEQGASTATTGTATTVAPATTAAPGTTATTLAEHQQNISPGETAALTAELVPVPGFRYEDVSESERAAALARLASTEVGAASFHHVIDEATGDEIGFLALYLEDPRDAMNSLSNARGVAEGAFQSSDVSPVTMSGQQVWVHEDASRPASRFKYVWQRHGTLGWLDGPDQAATERFLQGYFAVPFTGAEDPLLGRHMVAVPGYSFTNAVDNARQEDAAKALFPGARTSLHNVFDETHTFGGLVLVGPVQGLSDQEVVDRVTTWAAEASTGSPALQQVGEAKVGDVTVHHLATPGSKVEVFAWRWPDSGVVGWLATSRPDIGEQFVSAFLKAQQPA